MLNFKIENLLERLTIKQIFLIWFLTSLIFALIYHLCVLFNLSSFNYHQIPITGNLNGFLNLIYFSFITFTSTGFGDIVPMGIAKGFAIIEIFLGLLIFGMIVYKLVSVKQDMILEEVYSLSLEEYVNRIRSNLYISRANLIRFSEKVKKQEKISEKDTIDFGLISMTLNTNITDVKRVLSKNKTGHKSVKDPDESTTVLLLTSTSYALDKLIETLKTLKQFKFIDHDSERNIKDIYNYLEETCDYLSQKKYKEDTIEKINKIKSEIKQLEKFV
ncbi:MAG: potassium channel family protein [Nanoarchaeota archaeon]|nr:potassium channel family protein [Nanoarchaeota archaeon]